MGRERILRWLHRVGYVTTFVVAIELILVALLGPDIVRNRRIGETTRRETAYRGGSLRPTDFSTGLDRLPMPGSLVPNGLRFAAAPSRARRAYAVALRLRPGATAAQGLLVTTDRSDDGPDLVRRTGFSLPADRYRALAAAIDSQLDGFQGSSAQMLDGVGLAFERIRGRSVTSGHANLVPPYAELADRLLETIRPALPDAGLPPPDSHWHPGER